MGTPVAVTFACIYLAMLEKEAFKKMQQLNQDNNTTSPSNFFVYKRFIDDIFVVANSMESLHNFATIFNNLRPTIKITTSINNNSIDFLDLTIFKGNRFEIHGILDVKLFQKPFNKYVYLPPTSFHNSSVFKSFINAEIRRYRINCNNDCDFIEARNNFIARLKARGYSDDLIKNSINDPNPQRSFLLLNYISRCAILKKKNLGQQLTSNDTPILFKTYFNPRTRSMKLSQYLVFPDSLYTDPTSRIILSNQTQPVICYKRSSNLRELLTKAKYCFFIDENKLPPRTILNPKPQSSDSQK
jgi:hypothetical protein